MRARCSGRCGRHVAVRGTFCEPCLERLPSDLRAQLDDTIEQPLAVSDARRWLRQHPEGSR